MLQLMVPWRLAANALLAVPGGADRLVAASRVVLTCSNVGDRANALVDQVGNLQHAGIVVIPLDHAAQQDACRLALSSSDWCRRLPSVNCFSTVAM